MLKTFRKFIQRRPHLNAILEILGAIIIWWGVWGILDLFIFPENRIISYLTCIIFGFLLLLLNGSGLDDIK
ncbi:MAG TPA: hypothetical protein PK257_00070 [Candidatus Woesebacteria bacterium]|nr:hypothetical protein [Candidatus Woesebacteria bacterium]